MFQNLTDLSYKRTKKEAVGFYLGYLLIVIIIGGLVGGLIALVTGEGSVDLAVRAGGFLAVVICLGLSFAIIYKKSLTGNFGLILLALLSGVLAFFGGGILGLIPASYLSTK